MNVDEMRFRKTIRALREQQELREILGVQAGESMIDAAKRMRKELERLNKKVKRENPCNR
ncbi:MAG: hypothetical protein E6Q97_24125 [Desulfurellales bacterium]|nr:MAG: hypothetical protein E6Q97_24125 [Desulfurellales bacterium]